MKRFSTPDLAITANLEGYSGDMADTDAAASRLPDPHTATSLIELAAL